MRYLKYLFLALLAVVLLTVSLANRGMVTLRLLPEELGERQPVDQRLPVLPALRRGGGGPAPAIGGTRQGIREAVGLAAAPLLAAAQPYPGGSSLGGSPLYAHGDPSTATPSS